jgi:hypothetical protein
LGIIYVFHGIDDKSGVTMLAQSVAETLAGKSAGRGIGFVAMNGKPSLNYFRDGDRHVDFLKSRLESRIFSPQELFSYCGRQQNLRYIGGIDNEAEERYYQPELAAFMLGTAERAFDVTIVDAGNRLDNGLAFGALRYCAARLFVITQNESCIARWEKRKNVYEKLGVGPKAFVLNKYKNTDIYSADYVAKRLRHEATIHTLVYSREGRRAEMEHKTLARLDLAYQRDVRRLVDAITRDDAQTAETQRRSGWKNFISNSILRRN